MSEAEQAKHTPGPLLFDGFFIENEAGEMTASLIDDICPEATVFELHHDEALANGRLYAAAPATLAQRDALLEACRAVWAADLSGREMADCPDDILTNDAAALKDAWSAVRAAIALCEQQPTPNPKPPTDPRGEHG